MDATTLGLEDKYAERQGRRRKVKCTWSPNSLEICRECSEYDRSCVSQGVVNKSSVRRRTNLKIRINKLESIIERLSKSYSDKTFQVICETESSCLASGLIPASTKDGRLSSAQQWERLKSPIFDLFDNDVLQRTNNSLATPDISVSMKFPAGMSERDQILSVVADEPNILDILDVAGDWWIAWEDQYPGAKDLKARLTLRDTVSKQLTAADPVTVAAGLICIVMSLQQVRVGIDDYESQLSATPVHLIERIVIAVDQVILSKESYMCSMMGVHLLLLKAKQHVDSNQVRQAWFRIRQAIQAAQSIDLAKPKPEMSSAEVLGRQRLMGSMFETDRFLSLLLGLPYALDDNFTHKLAVEVISDHPDIVTRIRALRRLTAIASGNVNDRNSSTDPTSASVTNLIQQALTAARSSLPISWWDIESHAGDLSDPMLSHEQLMTQLWFYQTQVFLHLPFMLKAASDPTFEPSSIICLNSCRSLITIYNTLRSNPVLSAYTCKCEDFQGLLSTIVLLVGWLHYVANAREPDASSFEADLELVETTKETFRYARQNQSGNIAKQGLHVLDTLSSFFEGAEYNSKESKRASLFVPYFGTINIQAGPLSTPRDDQSHAQAFAELNGLEFINAPCTQIALEGSGGSQYNGDADHAVGFLAPSSQSAAYVDQDYSWQAYKSVNSMSDWDQILKGLELQQDWNLVSSSSTASN